MYFLMMPLSLSGGSQETNTTELLEAAALTPAGGPGTVEEEECVRFILRHTVWCIISMRHRQNKYAQCVEKGYESVGLYAINKDFSTPLEHVNLTLACFVVSHVFTQKMFQ